MEFAFEKTETTLLSHFDKVVELVDGGMKAKDALISLGVPIASISLFYKLLSQEQKDKLYNARMNYLNINRDSTIKHRILNGFSAILKLVESGMQIKDAVEKVGKHKRSWSIYRKYMPPDRTIVILDAYKKTKYFDNSKFNEILDLVKSGYSISTSCIKTGVDVKKLYNTASLGQRAELKRCRYPDKTDTLADKEQIGKAPNKINEPSITANNEKNNSFHELEINHSPSTPPSTKAPPVTPKSINTSPYTAEMPAIYQKRLALKTNCTISMLRLLLHEAGIRDTLSLPINHLIDEIEEYVEISMAHLNVDLI